LREVELLIRVLPHGRGLHIPTYMTSGSAAADLEAAVMESVTISPGAAALIPLGFEIAIPGGYEVQLRPRSGLALNHMITVLNSPATIDSDYRGEVSVLLVNHGSCPFEVVRGQRIAQLGVASVARGRFKSVSELPKTRRSKGGFGSTDV